MTKEKLFNTDGANLIIDGIVDNSILEYKNEGNYLKIKGYNVSLLIDKLKSYGEYNVSINFGLMNINGENYESILNFGKCKYLGINGFDSGNGNNGVFEYTFLLEKSYYDMVLN